MPDGERHGDDADDGLLHGLHGDQCTNGTEYSSVEVVHTTGTAVAVVYAEWCGDCGACACERVD